MSDLDDPSIREALGRDGRQEFLDSLALLDAAGNGYDAERFLAGEVTPVFFGSAMTDFGVEPFLERFVELAPSPRGRTTTTGPLAPDATGFSAFVFKIQANMDPRHRDRIAFLRICSGRFEPGMEVLHVRTGKKLPLARPLQFMAQERVLAREAWSGDIVGLWDGGVLRIGDTLCDGAAMEFEGIPRFSPEHFARVRLVDTMKRKQLKKGLDQLGEEGAVQCFFDRERMERDPILGAVGALQFEVVQHRLRAEYGAPIELDRLPYVHARWVEGDGFDPAAFERGGRSTCVLDVEGRPLVLFENDWGRRMAEQDHPRLRFVAAVQPGRSARSAA